MLPKINRLRADKDFKNVLNCGKTAEGHFLKIKFIKNPQTKTRFGFIVSVKFAKKAAVRNLIKRQLRSATRHLLKSVKFGFDIVIWPKRVSEKHDFQTLVSDLKTLLNKNDILSI